MCVLLQNGWSALHLAVGHDSTVTLLLERGADIAAKDAVWLYMYVCMHACITVRICMYVCMYVCMYASVYIPVRMSDCLYVYM